MKIIELPQGSTEWLEWRLKHITASEMPIIMGKSKWATPRLLWKRKVGFAEEQGMNPAMQKGIELEPQIRERVNVKLKRSFTPIVAESSDIQWAGASLDGWDEGTQTVLEIKAPNGKDHECAANGNVPSHYIDQVQWQLFVTGAKKAIYASQRDGDLVLVDVPIDEDYIAQQMLPAAQDFYNCVLNIEEPPFQEGEHIQISDPVFEALSKEWLLAQEEYQGLKGAYDEQKAKIQALKEKLVDCTDDGNCYGYGIRLTRVNKTGKIDWTSRWKHACSEVPGLETALPETKFAKPDSFYWLATKQ